MNLLIIALVCLGSKLVVADEYRYNLMVTTGLQECVFDHDGKETTIVFSKKSDAMKIQAVTPAQALQLI
jgi:hypothetical protein